MKKRILYLLTISLAIGFTACKKDSGSDNNNNDDQVAVHSDDQSRFSSEVDAVSNDADIALESSTNFTGRLQNILGTICDASAVMNTTTNPMTITITYDGTNCFGNRTRTGVVVLSMAQGTQWKNAGAAVTVSFQNLKITRIADNKSITINGTQTYTNVSGGLLMNLASLGTITHSITSTGLSVTFDNGSQRNWQVSKQRVFTFNGGAIVTTTGTHSDGNNSNIAEWGTNRFGGAFTTAITSPLIIRQDCDFRLTGGAVAHTLPLYNVNVTFGLNASGNPASCPAAGSTYYFKAIWTGPNGDSLSIIRPY
jgi:hypothetical protein